MDLETADKIADELAKRLPDDLWARYWWAVAGVLILFLLWTACDWISGYFKTKGQNLATKEDVEALTEMVETIKTEIAQKDWAQARMDKSSTPQTRGAIRQNA